MTHEQVVQLNTGDKINGPDGWTGVVVACDMPKFVKVKWTNGRVTQTHWHDTDRAEWARAELEA